jgi:hypothetical protein
MSTVSGFYRFVPSGATSERLLAGYLAAGGD